jgi:MFS family permease
VVGRAPHPLLTKVGFRPFIRLGLVVTAVAAIVLASTVQHDTLTALSVTSLSMGVGLGLASTALMIAVQTSVAWDQRGIATASTMFSRTIGGALAVGAMGGVLNASLEKDPTIPRDAASRVLSQEGLQALPPELVERLSKMLADGLGAVFWIVAGLSVVGCVIALWFPRVVVEAETH